MLSVKQAISVMTAICLQFVTTLSFAYIPEHQITYDFGFKNHCRDFRTAEDYSNIPIFLSLNEINQRDIAAIIPVNSLKNNEEGSHVASKILAQSLNSFLKSETIQQSGIARTAASVERAVDTNVAMGGVDDSTKHSINFKMKATDAKAILNYEGFANAQLSYQVGHDHELKLSMYQPLNSNAKIIFDSIAKKDDTIQQVSLNLSF